MREHVVAAAFWLAPALGISVLVVLLLLLHPFVGEPALAGKPASEAVDQGGLTASARLTSSQADLGRSSEGWQTSFTETFDSGIGLGWTVTDTSAADGGEYTWGARRFTPTSPITAAWCVGGGDGISLTPGVDPYPSYADSWLIHGPIELTEAWDAYVQFSWWMESTGIDKAGRDPAARVQRLETKGAAPDDGDWLGWCVLTNATDLDSAQCTYVSSAVGIWMNGVIPLTDYVTTTRGVTGTVSIAFRFISDGKNGSGSGAFVDDVELIVNRGHRVLLPSVQAGYELIEWNYPVIAEGSRIGVHTLRSNEVRGFAQDLVDGGTYFPVVKAVDDFGWVFDVARESPETMFVGRRVWGGEGCGGVERSSYNYRQQAEAAINVIQQAIDANPGLEDIIDYWEPYNEPDPPGAEGYRRLAELMIVTMDVAEEDGLKLALFSLNAGTPEWDEMEAIVETGVFDRARAGGHILALHEGTFVTHDPTEGWGSTIPGSPIVEGAGALNFRYRYLYHLLKERGEVVPLVVSEWYCGDEQSASTETLVNAVKWYDDEASKDYYFWATCPFTLGPTGQWGHTDYERVYPDLVDYMIDIKDRENALPPGWSSPVGLMRRSR